MITIKENRLKVKPEELRIGNWVNKKYLKHHPGTGSYWAENPMVPNDFEGVSNYPDNYKPIPLTPEWLERLGVKKIEVSGYVISGATYWRVNGINFYQVGVKYYIPIGEKLNDFGTTTIVFDKVHELQNIFALTGNELNEKANH